MNSLIISFNAVFPFIVFLGFGLLIRKMNLGDETFLKTLNKVVFSLFFPLTMFYNIHNISFNIKDELPFIILCILSLFTIIILSTIIVCMIVKENNKRGVIIQALYRSNLLLFALPLTESVFGNEHMGLVSLLLALIIPIYNVVAIVVLEYFGGGSTTIKHLIQKVLHNPLFLGAIVGLLFAVTPFTLPVCIDKSIKTISNLTTPLALMVLGGTTKITSIKKNMKYIISTLFTKMFIFPLIALVLSQLLHLTSLQTFIYLMIFATPIAVGSYTMAENMNGDGMLAGELVSISSILSVFTLFMWITILTSMNFI